MGGGGKFYPPPTFRSLLPKLYILFTYIFYGWKARKNLKQIHLILVPDIRWNTLFFLKTRKKYRKMHKTRKKILQKFPCFHTKRPLRVLEIIKSDLFKYRKNILRHFQKKWRKNIDKRKSLTKFYWPEV